MGAKRYLIIGLMAASIGFGCAAGNYPSGGESTNAHWGESYRAQRDNQILNPDAGKNLRPVVGIDGNAANGIVESYHKGFACSSSSKRIDINLSNIDKVGTK